MKGLHVLPLLVFCWFPITFILTYIIAVELRDVPVVYPYISDTGTFSPESCIFGQCLNMGALMMAAVVYIRYRQVRYIVDNHTIYKDITKLNKISLWLGCLGAFGISVVANFQETNVFSIHVVGAGLAFGLGTVYKVICTKLTHKLLPIIGTKFALQCRLFLTILCALTSSISFITAAISFFSFTGTDITKWSPDDGGYNLHAISSVTEWITAMCMMGYILSYTNDFRLISLDEPTITVIDNNVIVQSLESTERY